MRDKVEFNKGINSKSFDVEFILWKEKLNSEYSKYYFIDSARKEVWKENTTLNNKGDSFYHSVFITSSYFNDFYWSDTDSSESQIELIKSRGDEVFKDLMEKLSKYLHVRRNPYIEEYTDKLVM
jgi:hypothetical protein